MWELTSEEAAEDILSHEPKWLNTAKNRKALAEAISLAVETWISFQREQRRYNKSKAKQAILPGKDKTHEPGDSKKNRR